MKIYKSLYGWSAYCSNDFKGEKLKCYMPLSFKAGTEPEGESENINVTSFFMSCYQSKNGVMPKMVITEYVIVRSEDEFKKTADKVEKRIEEKEKKVINSDELPFY